MGCKSGIPKVSKYFQNFAHVFNQIMRIMWHQKVFSIRLSLQQRFFQNSIHQLFYNIAQCWIQQLFIIPISNNFIMNLNQFTYYRANPYVNIGYMPPTALINRHKPQYYGQMPMGEEHLNKIGRKQFDTNLHKSQIQSQNILASPQRYPYENRIALDKKYERNLNTIDIEGASGGTLVSQAVRNKMKARQQLNRRVQQLKDSENNKAKVWQPIKTGENYEQERRRKVAYEQYLKYQQLKQLKSKQQTAQQNENNNRKQEINRNNANRAQENISKRYYIKNRGYPSSEQNIRPRYQSIEGSRFGSDNTSFPNDESRSARNRSLILNYPREPNLNGQQSSPNSKYGSKSRQLLYNKPGSSLNSNMKENPSIKLPADQKSLRLFNPTNLSTESSISLAARNIINNK